jgi:hypothetical protein
MKLVAYLGGPRVRAGDYYWRYRRGDYMEGLCGVAAWAGAAIPWETYHEADPKVSAFSCFSRGTNTTAILPLEVDE